MQALSIAPELKTLCPDLTLGYITAEVRVEDYVAELWEEIHQVSARVKDELALAEISQLPRIKAAREVYRKLGKDPTRYRLSSESLLRRLLKGQELYQVNNVVDINNLVSLSSHFSIGSYDLAKIGEMLRFTIAPAGEEYEGIGRGLLNIENLPVLADECGSFGSATSDSVRAMVTKEATHVMLNIISFGGEDGIKENLDYAQKLLEKFAGAKNVQREIVR